MSVFVQYSKTCYVEYCGNLAEYSAVLRNVQYALCADHCDEAGLEKAASEFDPILNAIRVLNLTIATLDPIVVDAFGVQTAVNKLWDLHRNLG